MMLETLTPLLEGTLFGATNMLEKLAFILGGSLIGAVIGPIPV